jgi:SagB-type dehydrogenase family enzyme
MAAPFASRTAIEREMKSDVLAYLRNTVFDDWRLPTGDGSPRSPASFALPDPDRSLAWLPASVLHLDTEELKRSSRHGSANRFADAPLALNAIASLLTEAHGCTADGLAFPSAGGLYPIELLVALYRENVVTSAPEGVYHHRPYGDRLELLGSPAYTELRQQVFPDGNDLGWCSTVLIYCVHLDCALAKYGHRGLLFAAMDVGAICQNIGMIADREQLATRVWGGFSAYGLARVLDLNPTELHVMICQLLGHAPTKAGGA